MKPFREDRKYQSDYPVSIGLARDITFLAHWHSEVEMLYVLDGFLRVGVNHETRILKKGDFVICSSRDIHFYDSKNLHSKILMLIFRPEIVDCPGGWPDKFRFAVPFINKEYLDSLYVAPEVLLTIRSNFFDIHREIKKQKNAYKTLVKSRLLEICGLAQRYMSSGIADFKPEHNKLHSLEKMKDVLQYIESNYMNNLKLDDTARRFNFSSSHFSRLFKDTVGMSFTTFVNTKRIYMAKSILANSTQSITEIAFECGFESIRTFNRVFKSIMGYAPSMLR